MNPETDSDSYILKGTTLRVYRYLFQSGQPHTIREVQRGLALSSPSVAEYHLRKLTQGGLVKEGNEGYYVDKIVWQNMIRMRRTVIPFQAVYSVFFAAAVVAMVLLFRDLPLQGYHFGLIIIVIGMLISIFETAKATRRKI